jgi:hypothetical protein
VPRVEVVADPEALLDRLADAGDDLRQVALVEAPPASGDLGSANPPGAASVRFTRNDPEDVVLEVDAPGRGFLVLSDQYFPGWSATVNTGSVPIQRANYVFRLVEVPAGRSTVEFRYSPRSLWFGVRVALSARPWSASSSSAPPAPPAPAAACAPPRRRVVSAPRRVGAGGSA